MLARTSSRLIVAALGAALAFPVASSAAASTPTVAPPIAIASAHAAHNAHVVVLRKGSKGFAVRSLQRRLHVHPVSGMFALKTARAVRSFQRLHKLHVTGVVDAKTWRMLVAYTSTAPTVRRGSTGSWVKILQKQLHVTPRTGFFGAKTEAAVKAYELRHRLHVDGVVDGRVWALLGHGGTVPKVKHRVVAAARSSVRGRTCPVPGATFTDTFGAPRSGHTHKGVDMFKEEGAGILAVETGTVVRAHWSGSSGGWTITLQGNSGAKFFYGHDKKNLVKAGQHVTVGQRIALMGDTGNAKGNPQLHFEYWPSGREGAAVDPTPLVRSLC